MKYFILEVGVEEMPARFLASLNQELHQRFSTALMEARLDFGQVHALSTPRRLVVEITDVAATQTSEETEVLGPPARIALDDQGQPTKAGLGFAKSQDINFDQVYTKKTDKGEYLAVKKMTGGQGAAEILAQICAEIVSTLTFPKKMHWSQKDCFFGRPVRWLLALLDNEIVSFSFAGLHSSNKTYGHRVMGPGPFTVPEAGNYVEIITNQGQVILDAARRKDIIRQEGNALAQEVGGQVAWSEELLDQVANLVESPCAIRGEFAEKFLELPMEVLLTSMEVHQKSFGLHGADGALLPYFLTAANIYSTAPDMVQKGWERVLRARLEDARFFWEADKQKTFAYWLDKLDQVTFIGPLGSMGDKTRRLEKLAVLIAQQVAPELAADAARAGRLSKADLVSEMVYEFDTLQGQMGGIYARLQGETEGVAQALYEQYLPTGQDSKLPASVLGAILSIADKLDNLVGCFGQGMMPTGTADPYALRRNALGICHILLDRGWSLDLQKLLQAAQKQYVGVSWKIAEDEALEKLMDFFGQRLKALWSAQNVATLVLDAAMAPGFRDVFDTWQRVSALAEFARADDFTAAALTFKRAANIIRKQADQSLTGKVDPALFEHTAEQEFWNTLVQVQKIWPDLTAQGNYPQMLAQLWILRPVVDNFFDEVMVMCDDARVRDNRLNMLFGLTTTLSQLADFSRLQV